MQILLLESKSNVQKYTQKSWTKYDKRTRGWKVKRKTAVIKKTISMPPSAQGTLHADDLSSILRHTVHFFYHNFFFAFVHFIHPWVWSIYICILYGSEQPGIPLSLSHVFSLPVSHPNFKVSTVSTLVWFFELWQDHLYLLT